ncbi:cAMP-dependent protein kinase catalytic subunit gamma [Grifola frondosa]|uniref:cAMP-dependent protein kinase n=1 Tax=Grifola frondosa TaxID=5627 RepID=A0A1C7LP36_GRIFR|nr:cAMP-dependent protein kinase catalytic subunit gamma [Grifola frondosa]
MAPIRSTRSKHHDVNGVRDSGKGFSPYRLATVASGSKLLITPERNPRDRHLRRDPRPKRLQLKDLECIRRLVNIDQVLEGTVLSTSSASPRTSDTRDDPSLAQFAMKSVDKAYWRSVEREKDALNPKELKNIERRALVSLPWNPFIAGVLDAFSDKRNLYLMFELSPCVSLHHHIRAHGPVSDDAAKFYLANIMLGVEFLHSHGLVHRTSSQATSFMNANGYLSLGDFGEATPANEDGRWSQVGTGRIWHQS